MHATAFSTQLQYTEVVHNYQQFSKHKLYDWWWSIHHSLLTNVGSKYHHRPPVIVGYKTKEIILTHTRWK